MHSKVDSRQRRNFESFLLARQGLFVTPPLYASLTGPVEDAFTDASPCPACAGPPAFPSHVFFHCPAHKNLRQRFDEEVIRTVSPLLACSWTAAAASRPVLDEALRLNPALRLDRGPIPDHSKSRASPPLIGPKQYDPRSDPEILANGMPVAQARAHAAPVGHSASPAAFSSWQNAPSPPCAHQVMPVPRRPLGLLRHAPPC